MSPELVKLIIYLKNNAAVKIFENTGTDLQSAL